MKKDSPLYDIADVIVRTGLLLLCLTVFASSFDETEEKTLLIYVLGSSGVIAGLRQVRSFFDKGKS